MPIVSNYFFTDLSLALIFNMTTAPHATEQAQLFVPADVIDAFIDSGYKNTDYALAEILDNSIEAGAQNIHILIVEAVEHRQRSVWQVDKIAVLDDGCGMAPDLLSKVLTFGFGTHLHKTQHIATNAFGRMGKYGVGLPNSSISQCEETSVYSWQTTDTVHVSTLSLPKIRRDEMRGPSIAVPVALPKFIADMMQANGIPMPETGTVVLWEDLKRLNWSRSSTVIDHLEKTVGRIYRKFINEKKVRITISVFREDDYHVPSLPMRAMRVNDPLFLMENSIADELIDQKKGPVDGTLFKPYFPLEMEGKDYFMVPIEQPDGTVSQAKITLRFTITDRALRLPPYGGNSRIGRLAAENMGVSICRSGRELQLVRGWVHETDARNRWWGCEIDFPPALDSLFGVTNNKQSATKLETYGNNFDEPDEFVKRYQEDWSRAHPKEEPRTFTIEQILTQMRQDNDLSWVMLFILCVFFKTRKLMRNRIDVMKDRNKELDEEHRPAESASDGASREKNPFGQGAGGVAETDLEKKDPVTDPENQERLTRCVTENEKYASEEEKLEDVQKFKRWLESEEQVLFRVTNTDSSSFFDGFYDEMSQRIIVCLNSSHPAYENIFQLISFLSEDEEVGDKTINENKNKMVLLRKSLALLLFSWVSYERKEMMGDQQRRMVRNARERWGQKLEELLLELNKVQANEGD